MAAAPIPPPSAVRVLAATLALPVNAALSVPVLLLLAVRETAGALALAAHPAARLAGAALVLAGLGLFLWTVAAFARIGRGTLAPWDPPRRLVLAGPYRYCRHPMISGVLAVLAGEALLFGASVLGLWAGAFLAANAVYLPLVEEPGLLRRFGPEYEAYRAHVPRWIPRLSPWRG